VLVVLCFLLLFWNRWGGLGADCEFRVHKSLLSRSLTHSLSLKETLSNHNHAHSLSHTHSLRKKDTLLPSLTPSPPPSSPSSPSTALRTEPSRALFRVALPSIHPARPRRPQVRP
jgi:hypothetical protein